MYLSVGMLHVGSSHSQPLPARPGVDGAQYPYFRGKCDAALFALARVNHWDGALKRLLAGRMAARAAEDFYAVRNGSHGDFEGFLNALRAAG